MAATLVRKVQTTVRTRVFRDDLGQLCAVVTYGRSNRAGTLRYAVSLGWIVVWENCDPTSQRLIRLELTKLKRIYPDGTLPEEKMGVK